MAFRDDHDAALNRLSAVERELAETKAKLAEAESRAVQIEADVESEPEPLPPPRKQKTEPKPESRGDDGRHPRSPVMIGVCLALGPLLGFLIIFANLGTGDELADGATTVVVGQETNYKGSSARPVIEVDGRRYVCSHAEVVERGATVRYDRLDPSNCRLEADVGRMTVSQKIGIGAGVLVALFIIALGFHRPVRRP